MEEVRPSMRSDGRHSTIDCQVNRMKTAHRMIPAGRSAHRKRCQEIGSERVRTIAIIGLPLPRGPYGTAFLSSTDDGVAAAWYDSLGSGIGAQSAQCHDEERLGFR